MFAKLYGNDDRQLLVMQGDDQDGKPEVRLYFQPDGLGVSSFALGWNDDDEGYALADKCFNEMTEEKAAEWYNRLAACMGLEMWRVAKATPPQ